MYPILPYQWMLRPERDSYKFGGVLLQVIPRHDGMIPSPMHWRPGENLKMRKPKLPEITKIHLKHHDFWDIFWHLC